MLEKGAVVKSAAGHDKNKYYCVVRLMGEDRVLIANGKERKLEKPKRKNVRHLKATNTVLDLEVVETNKQLKAALWPFNQGLRRGVHEGGNQACQKRM